MISIFNILFRLDNLRMNGWLIYWHARASIFAVIECSNDHGQDEGFGVTLLLSPSCVPKTTEGLKSSQSKRRINMAFVYRSHEVFNDCN